MGPCDTVSEAEVVTWNTFCLSIHPRRLFYVIARSVSESPTTWNSMVTASLMCAPPTPRATNMYAGSPNEGRIPGFHFRA
jgi:hypothetical protein